MSKTYVGYILAFAILVTTSVFTQITSNATNTATRERAQTRQTLFQIDHLAGSLAEIENALNAYLLSKDRIGWDNYTLLNQDIPQELNDLEHALSLGHDANQQQLLREVHPLVMARLAALAIVAQEFQRHHQTLAPAKSQNAKALSLTIRLSELVGKLARAEQTHLNEASENADRRLRSNNQLVILGDVLSIVFLIAATLLSIYDKRRVLKIQTELRKREEHLQLLTHMMPQIVWCATPDGNIDYFNQRWYEYSNRTFSETAGWGWEESLHPDDVAEVVRTWSLALESGRPYETEFRICRFDGMYRWHLSRAFPVRDEHGALKQWLGTCTDIHDQKEAAQAALESHIARDEAMHREQMAVKASEMKSTFLANVSHELRTPINGVIGMAALLLDTNLDRVQKNYGDTILRSADSLLVLVNDILDISKAEAGKIEIEVIDFDFALVVKDLEKTAGLAAKKKGLTLNTKVPSTIPARLKGDPTRLRQVLANLIDNSIKFTSTGAIDLIITPAPSTSRDLFLRFEVNDTGIGISKEASSRLFQSFSQADASTTRRFGGTGLGLSICKHLVTIMGGEIGFESEDGNGSKFWFTLPFQAADAKPLVPQQAVDAVNMASLRILVVEDNSVNQTIALRLLEKLGHSAIAVANGLEALDALARSSYDLVFMDCQMPEMDGYTATREIRLSQSLPQPTIPIIALTANAMAGDREKCLECGMTDYVSKPVKAKDLHAAIERVMGAKTQAA